MEPFEVEGEWWLPASPEAKIAGTLTYDPDSGSRLRLVGALRDPFDMKPGEARGRPRIITEDDFGGNYARIHGLVGTTHYTLEDCFTVGQQHMLGGKPTETVHANQVLRGALFDDGEALAATSVSFHLRHLVYWVLPTGLGETMLFSKDGSPILDQPRYTLTAQQLDDHGTTLSDGLNVTFGHSIGISGDRIAERSVTQDYYVRLEAKDLTPIPELIRRASHVQALVSIGVDHTACFESMSFRHPDVKHQHPDGEEHLVPIEYFAQWTDRASRSPTALVHRHDMLFTYEDIGRVDGVKRWLDAALTYESELGRVMATRYQRSMYASDRLLSRAAALESFDRIRTKRKKSYFRNRMKRCAGFAGDSFTGLVGKIDPWLDLFRDARNDIAHHLGKGIVSGSEQLFLADSAYVLFVCCMLRVSAQPPGVFTRLGENQRYMWLARRLKQFV